MKNAILYLVMAAGSISLSAQIAGEVDISFGKQGIALFDGHQTGSAVGQAVKLLPDGSIQLGGTAQGQFSTGVALTRFQPDGRLDHTWAEAGKLILMDESGFGDMGIQCDGKILVIGQNGISIRRFLPDGTPDHSFGINGKLDIDDARLHGTEPMHIELLPDGKILVGGEQSDPDHNMFLLQLMPDGNFDPGFGDFGLVSMDIAYYDDMSTFLVQPDGKIVATGGAGDSDAYDVWIARFLPDGTADNTFGSAGYVIKSFGDDDFEYIAALVQQPDGRLVAGGFSGEQALLARFEPDGALDTTFGNNGLSQILVDFPDDYVGALALRPDGRIVVLSSYDQQVAGWALSQVMTDGTLDTTFAAGGYFLNMLVADYVIPVSIVLTGAGDIITLVITESINWTNYTVETISVLGKLEASGIVDNSFIIPGIDYELTYPNGDDVFDKFAVQPDGKIVGKRFGGATEQLVRMLVRRESRSTYCRTFRQEDYTELTD